MPAEYYLCANRKERTIVRRSRTAPKAREFTLDVVWWRTGRPTWKAYRSGDIVAPGDWPQESGGGHFFVEVKPPREERDA